MARKILIVDDEANILVVIREALSPHCEVLTACDGKTALEMVKLESPDLVFLDIAMPGMSGVQVLERIKEMSSTPVVWMLTGDEDLEMAAHTLKTGAKGYLTKPFDLERLRAVVINAFEDLERAGQPNGAGEKPWRVKKKKQ